MGADQVNQLDYLDKLNIRRLTRVRIAADLVADMAISGHRKAFTIIGLPVDARRVSIDYDPSQDEFAMLFEHISFPEIDMAKGELIPTLYVTVQTHE